MIAKKRTASTDEWIAQLKVREAALIAEVVRTRERVAVLEGTVTMLEANIEEHRVAMMEEDNWLMIKKKEKLVMMMMKKKEKLVVTMMMMILGVVV